jgi:hypothetical protein
MSAHAPAAVAAAPLAGLVVTATSAADSAPLEGKWRFTNED